MFKIEFNKLILMILLMLIIVIAPSYSKDNITDSKNYDKAFNEAFNKATNIGNRVIDSLRLYMLAQIKSNKENYNKHLKLKREELNTQVLIYAIIFVIIILFLLFWNYIKVKGLNKTIENLIREKNRNHDIGGYRP